MKYSIWKERPKEVANIFNPPFCCTILTSSIVGYKVINNQGMPFLISYLIFPLVLHKKTRLTLPANTRTSLAAWVENNPKIKFYFYENLLALKPFTGEALLFGTHEKWLSYEKGYINSCIKDTKITNVAKNWSDGEVRDCILKARIVGKWLAKSGSIETIMGLLGVKP